MLTSVKPPKAQTQNLMCQYHRLAEYLNLDVCWFPVYATKNYSCLAFTLANLINNYAMNYELKFCVKFFLKKRKVPQSIYIITYHYQLLNLWI